MSTVLTVIIALLVFGFLIFIHEFGHYITARIFKVSITEFSIGMGPKLMWYESKKTHIKYSLGMFPIGGYVAMVGEDEETDDPNAFSKKPAWQRLIITAAGAAVNILVGLIFMMVLTSLVRIGSTTIGRFATEEEMKEYGVENFVSTQEYGLRLNDTVLEVNGKDVWLAEELNYEIMRFGNKPVDLLVLRDGEEILLEDVAFPVIVQQEQSFGFADFALYEKEKTFGNFLSITWHKAWLTMRMTIEPIFDLISGRYTLAAVSGPVGISSAIGDAAKAGFLSLLNITVLISMSLGFMNLLPIPALDGGRIVAILFEMITRKKVPPKVEGIINGVGLVLLLGLSFIIMIKDIVQLF